MFNMQDDFKAFSVRLPADLYEKLKEQAKSRGVSMNAIVTMALDDLFRQRLNQVFTIESVEGKRIAIIRSVIDELYGSEGLAETGGEKGS